MEHEENPWKLVSEVSALTSSNFASFQVSLRAIFLIVDSINGHTFFDSKDPLNFVPGSEIRDGQN